MATAVEEHAYRARRAGPLVVAAAALDSLRDRLESGDSAVDRIRRV